MHFSSEESDLMGTVFKSAIRLLTGSASRKELAGELSSKLYAGRGDAKTMAELGIELEQPGAAPSQLRGIAEGTNRSTGEKCRNRSLRTRLRGDGECATPRGRPRDRHAPIPSRRAALRPPPSFSAGAGFGARQWRTPSWPSRRSCSPGCSWCAGIRGGGGDSPADDLGLPDMTSADAVGLRAI